ncbi:MAG: hypothetical protein HZB85_04635 [Deltaproteobacteria bacterium]|nr:hypothetical protein [Deltaproteobacteria bacterium]
MMRTFTRPLSIVVFLLLHLLVSFPVFAETVEKAAGEVAPENRRVRVETELDAYYSNVGLYVGLTDAPIPDAGERPEIEIYKELLFSSLIPRFLVLEAAVFPMPNLGVYLKDNARNLYDNGEVARDVNLVKAITAGFEEPYALSLFLGNVVSFTRPGEEHRSGNFGYMGYLVSVSNYNIHNNRLIPDKSVELEWKIKGDRKLPTHDLHWSFRVGGKLHGNPEIKDVVYLSLRRSRLDFVDATNSFFNNSGAEYTVDFDSKTWKPLRHYFVVDKKWPFKVEKMGFSFAVGFIWQGAEKYTGSLADKENNNEYQVILRPNIEF